MKPSRVGRFSALFACLPPWHPRRVRTHPATRARAACCKLASLPLSPSREACHPRPRPAEGAENATAAREPLTNARRVCRQLPFCEAAGAPSAHTHPNTLTPACSRPGCVSVAAGRAACVGGAWGGPLLSTQQQKRTSGAAPGTSIATTTRRTMAAAEVRQSNGRAKMCGTEGAGAVARPFLLCVFWATVCESKGNEPRLPPFAAGSGGGTQNTHAFPLPL